MSREVWMDGGREARAGGGDGWEARSTEGDGSLSDWSIKRKQGLLSSLLRVFLGKSLSVQTNWNNRSLR